MLRKLLKFIRGHLDSSSKPNNLPTVLVPDLLYRTSDLTLATYELQIQQLKVELEIAKRQEKQYPLIEFYSRLAQGVCFVPKAGRAFEFYREKDRLCVIVPFNLASGLKPATLVPAFLEIDTTRPVESSEENIRNRTAFIFKIPIRGWDEDMYHMTPDHDGNFRLNGTPLEPLREYSCQGYPGARGMFRREDDFCHVYLLKEFIQNRITKGIQYQYLLPGGLEYEPRCVVFEEHLSTGADELIHWKIPTKGGFLKIAASGDKP